MTYGIVPWTSFMPERSSDTRSLTGKVTSARTIDIPNNFRQTPFDSGAYNISAIFSAMDKNIPTRDIIRKNRLKLIPDVGVLPEVLHTTMESYGVSSRVRTFRWLNSDEKTDTIKYLLDLNAPIIALVRRHGYLHYITLTGFDDDTVYFYDPLLVEDFDGITIDNTDDISGNDSLSFDEFIDIWNQAYYSGFYKNMAIIIE